MCGGAFRGSTIGPGAGKGLDVSFFLSYVVIHFGEEKKLEKNLIKSHYLIQCASYKSHLKSACFFVLNKHLFSLYIHVSKTFG